MHPDDDPYRPLAPSPPQPKKRGGALGGALVALGLLAVKFKALLGALFAFKWLILAPKLLLSFGSVFVSLWFYALLFGWKFAIVFVALIFVHEMGHYVTFRNFGMSVSLPMFIPGLGAFVSTPMSTDPARNAIGAIMGPVFGVAASTICWAYGAATQPAVSLDHNFWIAAAYVGFFLNLFNLIPAYPLDGGRIAGAIDGRLWLLGAVLIVAWLGYDVVRLGHIPSAFTLLILGFVLFSSLPRAIAAFRGRIDPRERIGSGAQRAILAISYFGLLAICAAGAAATQHVPPAT